MKDYRDITYRYLKVQKRRTILTIIGIILSIALITSIGTMLISMREMMIKNEIKNNGDYHAIFLDTPGDKTNNIKNYVGVENSALINKVGMASLTRVTDEERCQHPESPPYRYLDISGYDKDAFEMLPLTIKEGRLPKNEGEILLEYWVLDYMPGNPKIGDIITLPIGIRLDEEGNELSADSWTDDETFEEKDVRKYTIVGLIQPKFRWIGSYISSGITFLDNTKLSSEQGYSVYVKMESIKRVHTRAEEIAEKLMLPKYEEEDGQMRYSILYNEDLLRLSAQSVDMNLNKSLIAILLFIIILIIVSTIAVIYNAFHISVLERISQFGILRCVGSSPSQIRNIVLKEAWILSIISIPIGLGSGILAMKIVMFFVEKFNFVLLEELSIVVSPIVLVVSTIIGLITVFLSALGPAKQASKIPALEAVRNTESFKKESFDKIKKSTLSRKFLGIEGEIAYKNLRRNRKRFNITVFSMVISIILYIVFSSFMTFTIKASSMNMEEMGDFAIWHNGGSAQSEFNDAIYRDLKALPGVKEVIYYHRHYVQMRISENKINPKYEELKPYMIEKNDDGLALIYNNDLLAYSEENFAAFKPLLKKGQIDIKALNKENGILLVQTARIKDNGGKTIDLMDMVNFQVRDEINITTNYGDEDLKYSKVKILGILEKGILDNQYNLNEGILMITTKEVYDRIESAGENPYFNIIVEDITGQESVREYLKDLVEKKPSYGYLDRAQQAEEDRNAATTISIFLYGFVAVITLIGSINIINTISTNLLLRTKELSMLKAVGMTKNGIKKMVSIEGVFYGIIASIYGGIIGTGLSYILYRFFYHGIQEFKWIFPWDDILISIAGATLIALISGYLPLRKINHSNIIDNMRMEE